MKPSKETVQEWSAPLPDQHICSPQSLCAAACVVFHCSSGWNISPPGSARWSHLPPLEGLPSSRRLLSLPRHQRPPTMVSLAFAFRDAVISSILRKKRLSRNPCLPLWQLRVDAAFVCIGLDVFLLLAEFHPPWPALVSLVHYLSVPQPTHDCNHHLFDDNLKFMFYTRVSPLYIHPPAYLLSLLDV